MKFCVCRLLQRGNNFLTFHNLKRNYHQKGFPVQQNETRNKPAESNNEVWQTVVLTNGVVACWHPAKTFPFEHSRPLDLKAVKKEKQEFFDRMQNPEKHDKWPYGEKGPENLALREIFYTNMVEWQPRVRERRLYKSAAPVEEKPRQMNTLEAPKSPLIEAAKAKQKPSLGMEKMDELTGEEDKIESNK